MCRETAADTLGGLVQLARLCTAQTAFPHQHTVSRWAHLQAAPTRSRHLLSHEGILGWTLPRLVLSSPSQAWVAGHAHLSLLQISHLRG